MVCLHAMSKCNVTVHVKFLCANAMVMRRMDSRHSSRDTNICLWEDVVVQKGPEFRCALNS